MKKMFKALLVLALVVASGCSSKPSEAPVSSTTEEEGIYTPGTYTGEGEGFGGAVTVTVTVTANEITEVVAEGASETPSVGGAALEDLQKQVLDAQSAEIDGVAGATFTSDGVKAAAAKAIAQAKGEEVAGAGELKFTPGTYTGKGTGYNGPVVLDVTFSETNVTEIVVNSSVETDHVGTPAYDILFPEVLEANGSGVDVVGGATFTSRAIKEAINDAATQAGATDMDTFKKNKVEHTAGPDTDLGTYDVIVVGAGGAGMATAAQATQNGLSVLVVEENAEIGGNTLVSGGQFQATMPYLVWDPANPDATEGTYDVTGQTYAKVKAQHGQLATLKEILDWSEAPFEYGADEPFEAGDIAQLVPHGVHAEYLPVLQELKKEIKAYAAWADAKLAAGAEETDLTLFSTVNLHIFQTYYGGLRRTADGTSWIYGDVDKVTQFCSEGYDLKTWLKEQGSTFNDATTITLIGALWYREIINTGCDLDGDGTNESYGSNNWNTYFAPTLKTLNSVEGNSVVTRTTVDSLVVADGKVVGIQGHKFDGTKVTATANAGVVLTTGGYAANVDMVVANNEYWNKDHVTSTIKTTNRSSLQGDGIKLGESVGAGTVGMGFPQMMPISWIDNGNLAFGNGLYANYISPVTGTRFVDESAERDVLSLGEFNNGATYKGVKGVFMEITNFNTDLTYPYPYNVYAGPGQLKELGDYTVDDRVYFFSSKDELKALLDQFGFEADPETIYATIEQYDRDMHDGKTESNGVLKMQSKEPVGNWDGENYTLDGVKLRMRLMAPSTHHTMGGLTVDTDRHVLDTNGEVIPGLYAAGEVTGGIHAGNRLGGNAIVEIFVSGRHAANTVAAEAGK